MSKIINTDVTRSVRLDNPGSNLVMFNNEITFRRDPQDKSYYYVIAKDYEWSFVALRAFQQKAGKDHSLQFKKVDSFPNDFNNQTQ